MIDFEIETGWYNKLIETSSTNLNMVTATGLIKREYNMDVSTYQVTIDLQKMTVDFYSQSFLRSSPMKLEFSRKFETANAELYKILKSHVTSMVQHSHHPILDLGIMSVDHPVSGV